MFSNTVQRSGHQSEHCSQRLKIKQHQDNCIYAFARRARIKRKISYVFKKRKRKRKNALLLDEVGIFCSCHHPFPGGFLVPSDGVFIFSLSLLHPFMILTLTGFGLENLQLHLSVPLLQNLRQLQCTL